MEPSLFPNGGAGGGGGAPLRPIRDLVEDITGFVPLQVYQLCLALEKIRVSKPADGIGQGAQPLEEEEVRDCLEEFSVSLTRDILLKLWDSFVMLRGVDLEVKVEAMSLAASGNFQFRGLRQYPREVDWRYYYPVGNSMVAKSISVLANRACIAATVEAARVLDMDKRKKILNEISGAFKFENPSVTGFIMEGIIIACLKVCNWSHFPHLGFPGWPAKSSNIFMFSGRVGHRL